MSHERQYDVLGIGAPIIDCILPVTEGYLTTIPGEKGGMEPIDHETLERIVAGSGNQPTLVPGGSASNAIKGLSKFGEKCALMGKIGTDALGQLYTDTFEDWGIIPCFPESSSPTAQVLCMVTPDGERTMRSCLGASLEMHGDDLDPQAFEGVKLVHVEGYSMFNDALTERAMEYAKAAGAKISLDLASFEIVRTFKERYQGLLRDYVDILFANEDESHELTGLAEEDSCDALAELCEVSVVLMGKDGCWVRRGNDKVRCPAYCVEPIDTTGAGDLFASGFLHGYLQNKSLQECAHYGALAGAAVVQVLGAEVPAERWPGILENLKLKTGC